MGMDQRQRSTITLFSTDTTAQSGTIGVVLLLAITVISTGAIVAFGSNALTNLRESTQLQRTEHSMTLFDSRAAVVALGESDIQTVRLSGNSGGAYHVQENSGWLRVEHLNYTNSAANPQHETIYNRSLGSIEYRSDESTIAYQGGGVWRKSGNNSQMISVPEFHYRTNTLTLPVIRVTGSGSGAGEVYAKIRSVHQAHEIYPNRTDSTGTGIGAPYDDDNEPYQNPVTNGTIRVTVHSEYYQGWAQFFRTRTDAQVTVTPQNKTVSVALETARTIGAFEMPNEGGSIAIRSLDDGHPFKTFTITLAMRNNAENHFSFWIAQGTTRLEIHVQVDKNPCSVAEEIDMSVYYYNGSKDTYHGWQNDSIDASATPGFEISCNGNDATVTADLLGSVPLEYKVIDGPTGGGKKWHFGSEITGHTGVRDPITWEQHEQTVSWEGSSREYSPGDEETAQNVTNHYLSLMGPNVDLTVSAGPGNSDKINEEQSTGEIEYEIGESRFLTFLHITDNNIEIEFS